MHTIKPTRIVHLRQKKSEISVRTYQDSYMLRGIYIPGIYTRYIYIYHMLNESQQMPEPRRQSIVPTRKRQDETKNVQIEIEKKEGREEK